jgi:chromosomal replication initiator protein
MDSSSSSSSDEITVTTEDFSMLYHELFPLKALWLEVKNKLQSEVENQVFSAYIDPLELQLEKSEISVKLIRTLKDTICREVGEVALNLAFNSPSRFISNHLERTYGDRLKDLFRSCISLQLLSAKIFPEDTEIEIGIGFNFDLVEQASSLNRYLVVPRVSFSSNNEERRNATIFDGQVTLNDDDPKESSTNPSSFVNKEELPNESHIISRYRFANFVVGNSNQFCHAAAMRVAEGPGLSYNPLFIYGPVGLGKTHLLHSIGNAVTERFPDKKVLYLSAETFTNDLIQALRHAKMEEFKRRLRNISVLLIDDIQFISGKERTQEEFFHTFNALYGAKRQIVLTSDKIPSEIKGIEERLQTRFAWGLTADLQAPDFETRVAILNRKASAEGITIPGDVAHYIAEQVSSNIRELEGALTRLIAMSSINKESIDLASCKKALNPLFIPKPSSVSVEDIKEVVCRHFKIKKSEIVSKTRTKSVSFARQLAMYLCRKHTTESYPIIGEYFGGRDHSSVIHSAQVVTGKIPVDKDVREAIEIIERNLFALR